MPSHPAQHTPQPAKKPPSHPAQHTPQPAKKPPSQPAKQTPSQPAQHSPFEDYHVNQQLTLDVIGKAKGSQIHVHVRQLITPRTLSCAMIVDIQDGGKQPKTAFLKLFDRRFAEQHRKDNNLGPWTKQIEEAYIREVESGAINGFLNHLHTIPGYQDSTGEHWNPAQDEAYLGDELFKCFQAETATYAALSKYQGHQIPQLLASVELKLTPPNAKDSDHFHVKGVLLEYLHGFSMSDMDKNTPNTAWQGLVDQAIGIVRILDSHNILNRDVRPGNIMITANGGKFQVYMIDFGLCRFRGNESEQDWGRAKFNEDEEGAIGMPMRKKLQARGFTLHFQNPDKYLKYAERG